VRLLFLRHGQAEPRETWPAEDGSRPLTADGRRALATEAAVLARLGPAPDVILSSPLARAHETASIVAEGLGIGDRLRDDERLAPGFGVTELEAILDEHREAKTLMLVGHEPDFSLTIGGLVGGAAVVCKKGGLARVDVDPESGAAELVWLLPPKVLTVSTSKGGNGGD
jgi:phosphohistidine phosphatase